MEMPEQLTDLVDSTEFADDANALRDVYDEQGYVFLRDQFPVELVNELREASTVELIRQGILAADGSLAITADCTNRVDNEGLQRVVQYEKLWNHPQAQELFKRVLDGPVWVFRQTLVRATLPGRSLGLTPPHQCAWNIEPNDDFIVVWTPLAPTDHTVGGVAVAPKSHQQGPIEHVQYPTHLSAQHLGSVQWGVPESSVPDHWAAGERMYPGDVLLFHPYLIHRSLPNVSLDGQVRVSLDTRIQPFESERGYLATHNQLEALHHPEKVFEFQTQTS
jgi:1-deoxypentalenic acid 11beta-hydroxylase